MGSGASSTATGPQDKSFLEQMIAFTKDATDAVAGGTAKELEKKLVEKRTELTKKARAASPGDERMKIGTMITLLQEQIYTAQGLPDNWESEMKYEETKEGVVATLGSAKVQLGSQFPEGRMRLVVTPLSRVCRQKIFEAVASEKIVHFFGPAGTGKTETIKDTLHDMGVEPVVVNCSGETTTDDIKKVLAEGRPVIFDEFNRLTADVMKDFVAAVSEKKTPIGITLNPAAKGASIPEELQSLCITQEMTIPDFELIAEIMLFTEGFIEGEALGRKLVKIQKDCKDGGKVSKAPHYDFGMRGLKALVNRSGVMGKKEGFDNEENVVGTAVLKGLGYSMNEADRAELGNLVKEAFPAADSWKDISNSDKLADVLGVRHGAMFVNVKEDDYIKAEAVVSELAKGQGAEVVRVPESGTVFSMKADDFQSKTAEAMKKGGEKSWFVLPLGDEKEGTEVASYLECMNTLLDDNKVFCTKEDKYPLKDGRVILVTDACSTFSPAIVSRLGCVFTGSF